jgi:small-conductance mechanosensitive channel
MMATSPTSPASRPAAPAPLFGRTRVILLSSLAALFLICLAFSWNTRVPLRGSSGKSGARRTIVDLSPWQTAQTLSALAVTAEEAELAQDALRLGDHAVDQAFASALRQAALQSAHRPDTSEVRDALKKVQGLQDIVAQDQLIVDSLSAALAPKAADGKAAQPDPDIADDLDVSKAQLTLDASELADAQSNLDRASGDNSTQIQQELNAHNAAQKEYDSTGHVSGEVAAVSVRRRGTLAARISAWFAQNDRNSSILQAQQQALDTAKSLTTERAAFAVKTNAIESQIGSSAGKSERLTAIRDRSSERQILDIYDDRIQTNQQLAAVYGKWSTQVQSQHGIVGRLILQSFSYIFLIAIGAMLLDTLIRQFMDAAALERRQSQTLRSILSLAVQILAVLVILLVIFGPPQETSTIIGLGTAALTIALQDFILAFLGWFVLVGKHGIHVGDWVEINGVGGEVTEVGLFSTSLLETGTLEDKGHPTGRRITFMNGFAIRGQYFNFSSSGQWMWDEISVTIPPTVDTTDMVERIHKLVLDTTEKNSHLAEQEWKRGARGQGLGRFSAEPVVNLRPSGSGVDTQVRYVTRASERFDLRNRLYQQIVGLLQHPESAPSAPAAS